VRQQQQQQQHSQQFIPKRHAGNCSLQVNFHAENDYTLCGPSKLSSRQSVYL